MTRDRDIERVLDRFYSDGPSEMPDRLCLGVIDRIEHVPQRRLARLETRFTGMSRNARLAAAAAVVAVVGAGVLALQRQPSIGGTPSPTPLVTQSQSALLFPREALYATWFGQVVRPIVGTTVPPDRSGIKIDGDTLVYYYSTAAPVLASSLSPASPTALQLVLSSDGLGCHQGDVGLYNYALSTSGQTLTLDAVSDTCSARSTALSGGWDRVGCAITNPNDACLGNLDPGAHVSTLFTPFVPPASWAYDQGRFAYVVPAGWSNPGDGFSGYTLAKVGGTANEAINAFSDIQAHSQDTSCPQLPEPGIGRTARALATWLATLPGLVTTTPASVTVGGLSGFQVDISVAPGWTHGCGGGPVVSTFTDSDTANQGFDWNVGFMAHARYMLLDLGDGRAMLVSIEADNQAAWTALVAEATPIIATFQFKN